MHIYIASTQLAGRGFQGPRGLTVGGTKITDAVQLIRAALEQFWDRGGKAVTVSFGVSHEFNSVEAAAKWMLESWGLLPNEGDVIFYLDDADPSAGDKVYMLGAQLEAQIVGQTGVSVDVQYTLRGPPPQSSNPPAVVPDPDAAPEDPVIQRDRLSIASGAEEKVVTFGSAFAAAPFITCSLEVPAGSPMIDVAIVKDSPTTTGFTARLGAETPNANYKLTYLAIAAP